MTNIRALERHLLDLVVPAGRTTLPYLDKEDWAGIDRMAAQHRLLPLLHYHAANRPGIDVPASMADHWKNDAQQSTIDVLLAQRDLLTTLDVLSGDGIEPVILKGGYLAFASYPQPGLRPLRDVDLWVEPDRALAAFQLLVAAGYAQRTPGDPERALTTLHQLPALEAPNETLIELHTRISHDGDGPNVRDHVRQWTLGDRHVLAPTPAMMMLHLIIHAAYDHRFDNGPLTLADVAFLLHSEPVDEAEWRAIAAPWRKGADLVFELLSRHGVDVPAALLTGSVPGHILDLATSLITQDLDQRDAARTAQGPGRSAWQTVFPDEDRLALLYGNAKNRRLRHWGHLINDRLPSYLRGLRAPEARQIGNMDKAYRSWLHEQAR